MHAELASTPIPTPIISIRGLKTGDDGTAFRTLNEEWITRFFTLEDRDREVLNNPDTLILQKGGHIFYADVDGETIGCVALVPMPDEGVYELSKMAVAPHIRGLGIGRRLLEHAIAQARLIGARSLFLGSSRKLANAVHLYESLGFRHIPADRLPYTLYARADVFMDLPL